MDSTTRAHVTGKVDMDKLDFTELKQVVQSFCNLIASTGKGSGAIAIDIGSIASVPGTASGFVISDEACSEKSDQRPAPVLWSIDEAGWPLDEEG